MICRPVRPLLLAAGVFLTACSDAPPTTAPVSGASNEPATYVVILRDTTTDAHAVIARIRQSLPSLRASVPVAVSGINARIVADSSPAEVLPDVHAAVMQVTADDAAALRNNPAVAVVEPVREMTLSAVTTPTTNSWALDRINQAAMPLDGRMTRFGGDGSGVRIAIFDTGIRWTHADLRGRVSLGYDAFTQQAKVSGDEQGHGTFVASLAAGTQYGTAPAATLLDVRVLDARGSGTSVQLLRGVNWVIAEKRRVAGPVVANMSFGFNGGSAVVDAAVDRLRAAGIAVVVAAGNERTDACNVSPARVPGAITVGATGRSGTTDTWASFSNGGRCVDLNAPGEAVLGAGRTSDAVLVQGSGTSMAAPYVAGAAAVFFSANRTATPDAATTWLIAESAKDRISGVMANTPNRVLSLTRLPGAVATPPAPAPTPTPTPAPTPTPSASTMSLTNSCTNRTCTLDAGVPTGVSATEAATLVYRWNIGPVGVVSGTNLRRQTITFGSAASITVTVTALRGTSTVASNSVTVTVK